MTAANIASKNGLYTEVPLNNIDFDDLTLQYRPYFDPEALVESLQNQEGR